LHGLPDGVVVIDRSFQISFINAGARRLFGIHSTAIGEDLIHVVQHIPLAQLRAALDEAFHGEPSTTVVTTDALETETSQQGTRFVEVSCFPVRDERYPDRIDSVALRVLNVSEIEQMRGELEATNARLQRLIEAHRAVVTANEELASVNAALRVTTEELLVSNEEFQAATEEVETLNEEMQATNEELETLNEELLATVEELNTTNDDLQARGLEMHDLTTMLEEQRRRSEAERALLESVLASMGDAVLVVDPHDQTMLSNAAFAEMFGERGERLRGQDEAGNPVPLDQMPRYLAAGGETFTMEFSQLDPDGRRRLFEASGRPVAGKGGVVVIREITERGWR
jgi:two-component system CheB/CheR fusion protein